MNDPETTDTPTPPPMPRSSKVGDSQTPRGSSRDALLLHRAFVRRLALQLARNEADADDLEQQVWLKALQRPPKSMGHVRAWLRAVVTHQFYDRVRGQKNREAREATVAASRAEIDTSGSTSEMLELTSTLDRAVEHLPKIDRTLVRLRYEEGLTPREISNRLSLSDDAVRSRLKRCRQSLRQTMIRTHGPDALARCLVVFGASASVGPNAEGTAGIPVGPRGPLAWTVPRIARVITGLLLLAVSGIWVVTVLTSPPDDVAADATAGTDVARSTSTIPRGPEPGAFRPDAPVDTSREAGDSGTTRPDDENAVPGAQASPPREATLWVRDELSGVALGGIEVLHDGHLGTTDPEGRLTVDVTRLAEASEALVFEVPESLGGGRHLRDSPENLEADNLEFVFEIPVYARIDVTLDLDDDVDPRIPFRIRVQAIPSIELLPLGDLHDWEVIQTRLERAVAPEIHTQRYSSLFRQTTDPGGNQRDARPREQYRELVHALESFREVDATTARSATVFLPFAGQISVSACDPRSDRTIAPTVRLSECTAGSTTTAVLPMERMMIYRGTVRDLNGTPMPRVAVYATTVIEEPAKLDHPLSMWRGSPGEVSHPQYEWIHDGSKMSLRQGARTDENGQFEIRMSPPLHRAIVLVRAYELGYEPAITGVRYRRGMPEAEVGLTLNPIPEDDRRYMLLTRPDGVSMTDRWLVVRREQDFTVVLLLHADTEGRVDISWIPDGEKFFARLDGEDQSAMRVQVAREGSSIVLPAPESPPDDD